MLRAGSLIGDFTPRAVEYPSRVSETVRAPPHLVIDDEEIFAAHHGGKLNIELKSPLDTQRALSIATPRASPR